jgi:putative ABC transport system substrate-binding protein
MERRTFMALVSGGLLTSPLAVEAQQAEKVYRLGYLGGGVPDERNRLLLDSFRQALRDLGYLEGRNIVVEIRYAEGKVERLPELAAELVRSKVDLIVTGTGTAALAAKKATQTIPIVMLGSGDAVRQGLVASLAHPGGNVTGLTMISPDLSRKRLGLLRELLPKLSHVGGL